MPEAPAMSLTVDGEEYIIRFEDFTALDSREFRREMGMSLAQAFTTDPDLDMVAGLLWLHRRKTEPKLKYEDVAKKLTYLNIEVEDPDPDADGSADPAGSEGGETDPET